MSARDDKLDLGRAFYTRYTPIGTSEEAECAKVLKDTYRLTRADIGEVMGLSTRQVMTRLVEYKNYVAKGLIPSTKYSQVYNEDPREEVLGDEAERRNRLSLNRESRHLLATTLFEDRLATALAEITPTERDFTFIKSLHVKLPKVKRKSSQSAFATISDLHAHLSTLGHPAGKSRIAMRNFMRKIKRLTELQRESFNVDTLYAMILGDIMQGTSNYPNQRWDVDAAAIDQAKGVAEILIEFIEFALTIFDKIVVVWANGNHEYIEPHKTSTDPDHSSWGTVIANYLQYAFRNEPRFEIKIPETWYQIVDIEGYKFMVTHGHVVSGGGTYEKLIAQARKWQDILPQFDYLCMGHFHRYAELPLPRAYGSRTDRKLLMNGTAVESDDFLERGGGSPTPLWWMGFVSANHGITNKYDVRLYEDD